MYKIVMVRLAQSNKIQINVLAWQGNLASFWTDTWVSAFEWLMSYIGTPTLPIQPELEKQMDWAGSIQIHFKEGVQGTISAELMHSNLKVAGVVGPDWSGVITNVLALIASPGL